MADGFEVDLAALEGAGRGIARIMRDMADCDIDDIDDMDDIDGGAAQYGHDGLHEAFEHFCNRWQYGVEVLIKDGEEIARGLTGALNAYVEAEEASVRALRAVGSGADPAVGVGGG